MLVEQSMASTFNRLSDPSATCLMCFWPAIESAPLPLSLGVGLPSELRRDYDFPAKWSERFTYQFFVQERAVYLGSIEERDTLVPRRRAAEQSSLALSLGGP